MVELQNYFTHQEKMEDKFNSFMTGGTKISCTVQTAEGI